MDRKSCFFIGHRESPYEILPELEEAIETHIREYGVTDFIVGNYGSYDRMAANCVIRAKAHHPEITLTLLLPFHPAERKIKTPEGFDTTYYPLGMETVPRRFAIVRANHFVVDHVDYLIAYAWHPGSNARNLVEYARKREKKGMIRVYLLSKDRG